MYETLGISTLTAPQAAVAFGALLGVIFGALAQVTRFCLRRALVSGSSDRRSAAGIWVMALAVAILGVQAAVAADWISFSGHRFLAADLPVLALVVGGLAFGAGMVLTRGCISRQTVLLAGGNLRSLTVLLVVAITAHATMKGVLSPLRSSLASVTLPLGDATSLAALPGGALVWSTLMALALLLFAARSGAHPLMLVLAAVIGAVAAAGWIGTGFLLYDDFDPVPLESLAFTAPAADTLFWAIASTAVPPDFGVGLFAGTLAGAFAAAVLRRETRFASFDSPSQTGRYLSGAVLMGVGGVLAGGCTVGAGLSGVPTLSVTALLALASIVAGALATDRLLGVTRPSGVSGAPAERPAALPAE